jgi:hypothetical protein
MFFDLIAREFDRSASEAAKSLSATLNTAKNSRAHRRRFSGEALYQRVSDRYTLTFNQVDAISLHYELPMAAILLFSRVRSELEHGGAFGADRAVKLMQALRKGIDTLEKLVEKAETERLMAPSDIFDVYEHLNYDAFRRYQADVTEVLYPDGGQLGLPLPEAKGA